MTVACCEATAAVAESTAIFAASSSLAASSCCDASSLCAGVFLLRVRELHARAIELAPRFGQVGACLDEVRLHLLELRIEQRRIEPRDDLALLDDAVEVGAEPLDVAGHLAADLNGCHRLQGSGRADGVDDVAAIDGRGRDLDLGAVTLGIPGADAAADDGEQDDRDNGAFHIYWDYAVY